MDNGRDAVRGRRKWVGPAAPPLLVPKMRYRDVGLKEQPRQRIRQADGGADLGELNGCSPSARLEGITGVE